MPPDQTDIEVEQPEFIMRLKFSSLIGWLVHVDLQRARVRASPSLNIPDPVLMLEIIN